MTRSFEQLEHTADLALELRGDDEAEVLLAGLEAIVSIVTQGACIAGTDAREVELRAVDPPDRLVRWLNEILYMATVEGFVPSEGEISLDAGGLRATLRGESDARSRLRTEIKGATYHAVELGVTGEGGWRARVVLDV